MTYAAHRNPSQDPLRLCWTAVLLMMPLLVLCCGGCEPSQPPVAVQTERPPGEQAEEAAPAPAGAPLSLTEDRPKVANPLSITGTVPLPGERVDKQIVLFFDRDVTLLADEADANKTPFTISPAVKGTYRMGKNFAAFTAAKAFEQGKLFQVTVNPLLLSESGQALAEGQHILYFATFNFEPQRLWMLDSNEDEVRLAILLPVEVPLDELGKHLTVTGPEEQAVPHRVEAGSNANTYRIVLNGNKTWPVRVTVTKGLCDTTGAFELAREHVFGYPSDPFFHVTSADWEGIRGEKRAVGIRLSKFVEAEALARYVTITDDGTGKTIPFEMEAEDSSARHHLLLDLETPDAGTLTVSVAKGLMSTNRAQLIEAFSARIDRTPDPLKVANVRWGRTNGREHVIELGFSHAVKAEALRDHLSVTDAATGEKIPAELRTRRSSTRHTLVITPSQSYDLQVALTISANLPGEENTLLAASHTTTLDRPAPALAITYSHWRDWPPRKGLALRLNLNLAVKAADLKEHLEITPEVTGLRVEPEGHRSYRIYADWRSETDYAVKITQGLEYTEGGKTPHTISKQVKTEKVPQHLGFSHESKYYFPMRAASALKIESRNVEKADVTLHRVFPSNLVVALSDMGVYRDSGGSGRTGSVIRRWSEEIASKSMELQFRPDYLTETPLDLETLLPTDTRGVFCVEARGAEGTWGAKVVLLTRIGALAHWRDQELVLFAHDLVSLAPLPMAKITLYSSKNQLMGMANTGPDGIARLSNLDTTLGTPRVAVIEHGKDFTFLELTVRNEGERPGAADMPRFDKNAYDGFLYADRDLYRPGETAHLRWIVRTNYGDALPDVPLLVTVKKPDGRPLLSQPTELSALGTGQLDIHTLKTHPTGKYTVELTVPGSETRVGSYRFSLEEFVPNRIESKASIPAKHWLANEKYDIQVSAQHLFGAPAADRRSTCKVLFERGNWQSERWKGFLFQNDSPVTISPVACGEQRTDAEGKATFSFSYPPPADVTFPLNATAVAGVYELGGRAVISVAETTFFPSNISLGIRAAKPEGGPGIQVFAAAVQNDESPADLGTVKITLEKQVWNYYVRRYYSNYESNWAKSFDPIETREVSLQDGLGSTVFAPPGYGYYRVRVHSEATKQFSTFTFYAYDGRFNAVASARPSLIKLAFEKDEYEVGEEAVLRIESPFNGQGIVVLNGESLQDMIPVTIEDNAAQVRFTITEDHFPNIWVEATVIHTVRTDRTQVYPFSSFAMANLRVNNPKRRLEVAFPSLAEEVRPAGQAEFAIEVHDGTGQPVEAELTLAAVDEGIHALTRYQSPTPHAYLSRSRSQDYRRAHYYDKVAYDFDKPLTGGDAARALAARSQSQDDNWIKPVALWSGVVRTNKEGRAQVVMDLPEFNGKLRLVAVACTATATGAHSGNIFVRRPYMLRTSMPRFLLPEDSAQCRATLFNTTDGDCKAQVKWTATGPLNTTGGEQTLAISAHGEATLLAGFTAARLTGQAEIRWEALFQGPDGQELDRLDQVAPVPVRTPAAYQTYHDLLVLAPGESRSVRNEKCMDDERTELEVHASANPQMRLYEALRYVVRYPYGCVEQTTSAVLPMYALRASKDVIGEAMENPSLLDSYLQAGIDRLFSMQTTSGGLAYWPGGRKPYPYGSVYALHFLTLAKRERELTVPEAQFQGLQDYVRSVAEDWSRHNKSDLYQRAYALYVLCLGGDIKAIEQIQRFDAVSLPQASRYLLAAALALNTQDVDRVKLYLSSTPSTPYEVTERSGTLSSDIRNLAVEVLALKQIGGDAAELHGKAKKLITYLEQNRYGNTQESAFVVTALAAYFEDLTKNQGNAAATVVGPEGQKNIDGTTAYQQTHKGPAGLFTVSNTGQTQIFINVTTGGIPLKPETAAYSDGVAVTRAFRTNRGEAYTSAELRQSEAYVVELALKCDQDIENLVVADLLPAGIEIENPRMRVESLPKDTFKKALQPSYLDVRDDRLILAFDKIRKGTHHFYYVVRAVTPGTYQYPPVVAECMYDASVKGASESSTIRVMDGNTKDE